jgi:queuine tRNA-ribosyltransferase
MDKFKFETKYTCKQSGARIGEFTTPHGVIETPVFMPVGTQATVKSLTPEDLKKINTQILLSNTYHLHLRPGEDIVKKAGGLHKFMNWDRPILTDSGGFQVFSLADNRKLTEEGAIFRSHIDGSKHFFTPENVVDIQRTIGADIMMAFDECTPGTADYKYAKNSMERTHRWLKRGLERFDSTPDKYGYSQTFFPIVQGCVYPELRRESAKFIADQGREGNAIGGLAVGEPTEKMYEMIEVVNDILPKDRPRYLMGVGTPANLLEGIERGVDMFDCVMPTRNGRNGMLFTRNGIMNMKNKKWADDFSPIDPESDCFVDLQYSKAYLRHLFVSQELLAMQIASIHNLAFYLWLVKEARKHIIAGDFHTWKPMMLERVTRRL